MIEHDELVFSNRTAFFLFLNCIRPACCVVHATMLDEYTLHGPSIRDTMSEREHYLPIYKRYADDTAMSELTKASRAGRGVP